MSTSAQALIAAAPVGALVSYSDGRPRPPTRFKRTLAEWRRFNGVGRLDGVTPAEMRGAHEFRPASSCTSAISARMARSC